MIAWLCCTSLLREKKNERPLSFLFYFVLFCLLGGSLYFKQNKPFCVHLKFVVFCLHAAGFFLGEGPPDATGDLTLRELII